MQWEKKGKIISLDDFNIDWMESHTQVPVALLLGNGDIRLYFNSRCQGRSLPTFVELERETYKITYVNERPLLDIGRPGTFDDSGVMVSSVIEIDGKIYMYYIGWNQQVTVCYQNAIGLAVSADGGKTFSKYSEGPILGRNVFEPIFTSSPWVIKSSDGWTMYYLSCIEWISGKTKMEPVYNIKYAVSDDGIGWRVPANNVCINGVDEAIANPCVILDKEKYKMWYSTRKTLDYRTNVNNTYRIGYAESEDGIAWERKDKEVGITLSEKGWDSEMIAYANVINLGEEKVMFYNGNGFGRSGIGYAVLKEE